MESCSIYHPFFTICKFPFTMVYLNAAMPCLGKIDSSIAIYGHANAIPITRNPQGTHATQDEAQHN